MRIEKQMMLPGVAIKRDEMLGKRFGKWRVLSKAKRDKHGHVRYNCRCDCGNVKIVSLRSMEIGQSTSCGCNTAPDLSGQRFGRLTVIKKVGQSKNRKYKYLCKCVCGNTSVVISTNLRDGQSKSCGCLHKENGLSGSIDITGQVFGKLTAIKEVGKDRKGEFMYLFRCNECGREMMRRGRGVREKPDAKRCDCGEAARKKAEAELAKKNVVNPRDDHAFAWDIYCCYVVAGWGMREIAEEEGYPRGCVITGLLMKHVDIYAQASRERRNKSPWARQLERVNMKSKLFRYEKDFQDACCQSLSNRGVFYQENDTESTGFEIDILTSNYCYELKVTTLKKNIYRAMGQLKVNAEKSGLKPALVIPSDTRIHEDLYPMLKAQGIEIFTELTLSG